MIGRLFVLVVFFVALYAGYFTVECGPGGFPEIGAELIGVGTMSRSEEILEEYFDPELASRAIPHLRNNDRLSLDRVIEPRPRMNNIIISEGNPESVETVDLSYVGLRRQGTIHWYGRLGLVTQVGGSEVIWVVIAARENYR
jgi:hypothetical protein